MKRIFYFIIILINTVIPLMAQDKTFTLDDLIPGGKNYAKFSPSSKELKQLRFIGDHYLFVQNDTLYKINPAHKKHVWVTKTDLQEALENTETNSKKLKRLPFITVASVDKNTFIRFDHDSHSFVYSPDQKKIVYSYRFEKGDTNKDINPKLNSYAVTNGSGLYLIEADGNRTCIAKENKPDILFGSERVYRNEFGLKKGTYWSPQGNALAFYRMDESMVGNYPLVDISAREGKLINIKYPMVGMKSHQTTIGVYRPADKSMVFLKTGAPKDRYLTNISWSPDEKEIYLQEVNRGQDTCSLVVYSSETGKRLRTLFTDSSKKYTEPEHPILFIPGKSDRFILLSRRNGYRHMYLYDTTGKLIKQLTTGPWEVLNAEIDKKGENIYFTATEKSPLEVHYYKLNFKNGKYNRLTQENGVHSAIVSESGRYLIDNYSNHSTPRIQRFYDLKSGKNNTLYQAADPYKGYGFPEITCGTIKADDDSTDLYYRLIKPVGFDPQKKYPTVIYVYGGPHAQMIHDTWMWDVRGWDIYMAQNGYIVFSVDGRGSNNRGLEFESAPHRRLGEIEGKDQMRGVAFLKSLPYVDQGRMGVHGWSFGGFMTTYLMTHYPETFKVGVAGGPVIDWKYYEVMYGERYMGTPQNNPEGYEKSNLNNYAGNLKGHLLLIHGDQDPVVVMQHSLSFLDHCVKARTYPDYFVYPGHEHNVIGLDRVHLHEKITRYFNDYLK